MKRKAGVLELICLLVAAFTIVESWSTGDRGGIHYATFFLVLATYFNTQSAG